MPPGSAGICRRALQIKFNTETAKILCFAEIFSWKMRFEMKQIVCNYLATCKIALSTQIQDFYAIHFMLAPFTSGELKMSLIHEFWWGHDGSAVLGCCAWNKIRKIYQICLDIGSWIAIYTVMCSLWRSKYNWIPGLNLPQPCVEVIQ